MSHTSNQPRHSNENKAANMRSHRLGLTLKCVATAACALLVSASTGLCQTSTPRAQPQMVPTDQVPARFVGRIAWEDPRPRNQGIINGGTGALIGPRHVLTAAHVIWAHDIPGDGFPQTIKFYLGLTGDPRSPQSKQFATAEVVGVYMQRKYQDLARRYRPDQSTASKLAKSLFSGGAAPLDKLGLDIAILKLDRDLSHFVGGHFAYRAATTSDVDGSTGSMAYMNGYDFSPATDPRMDAYHQFQRSAHLSLTRSKAVLSPFAMDRFHLWLATWTSSSGASGGPVWKWENGVPVVIGINSGTRRGQSGGVLIDEFYSKWIKAYLDQG